MCVYRNLANREIKSAKSNYYCEVIKDAKGDSTKIWKAVYEASCRNNRSSAPQCIIVDEGVIVSLEYSQAELQDLKKETQQLTEAATKLRKEEESKSITHERKSKK